MFSNLKDEIEIYFEMLEFRIPEIYAQYIGITIYENFLLSI